MHPFQYHCTFIPSILFAFVNKITKVAVEWLCSRNSRGSQMSFLSAKSKKHFTSKYLTLHCLVWMHLPLVGAFPLTCAPCILCQASNTTQMNKATFNIRKSARALLTLVVAPQWEYGFKVPLLIKWQPGMNKSSPTIGRTTGAVAKWKQSYQQNNKFYYCLIQWIKTLAIMVESKCLDLPVLQTPRESSPDPWPCYTMSNSKPCMCCINWHCL